MYSISRTQTSTNPGLSQHPSLALLLLSGTWLHRKCFLKEYIFGIPVWGANGVFLTTADLITRPGLPNCALSVSKHSREGSSCIWVKVDVKRDSRTERGSN